MKKLLVIAVALASVNAFATRARVIALANSPHLVDTQTVYTNPADIFGLGDYVTLETGLTAGTSSTNQAEGMVVRTMGDAKMGLSLGHQSQNASTWGLRPAAFGNQQNPFELTYGTKAGDMNWAATLVYSNYQDKAAAGATIAKESSMGVRLGARSNNWDASVRLGLTNTAELGAGNKFTGTLGVGATLGYQMDALYWVGHVTSVGFKVENAAGTQTTNFSDTAIDVGVMTSVKKDGSEMFYGAKYLMDSASETVASPNGKITNSTLPVWIGLEVDAASWLTLRGSVTQTVLIDSLKTEGTSLGAAQELSPGANNTVVAAGAGLKFNKIVVDGTLQAASAATSQQLNGNSLLSTLGMTYNF